MAETDACAVTQADRDAFATVAGGWWRNLIQEKVAEFAREGLLDDNELVQAFARHRLVHERATTDFLPSARSGEEICRRCGHENPAWAAPSPLWNAVMRGGSINGEALFEDMVCASCFMSIAMEKGIASGFRLSADNVTATLETVTPSGRRWNDASQLWRNPTA